MDPEAMPVPIVLKNGSTVYATIDCCSPKAIYYYTPQTLADDQLDVYNSNEYYFIELRTSIGERNKLEDMRDYIINNEYVNDMTRVYDMIDEGEIFDYVMEITFDDFMYYISDIAKDNDHLNKLSDYFIVYYNNHDGVEFVIIDADSDYRLNVFYEYESHVSFELNGKTCVFDVESNDMNQPIKNYLFNNAKSASNY